MLKLNKTQKEIEELAKRLPRLTDEQKEWARKHFNYFHLIRQGATEIRCPDCKCIVPIDYSDSTKGSKWCDSDRTITCPHCGATIQVRTYPSNTDRLPSRNPKQEDFFQVMTTIGDWQVTRQFYMRRYCYVRKENTDWEYWEVCQAWNNPKFPKTFFRAFPKICMSSYHFNPYKLWDWTCKWDNEKGRYIYTQPVPCEMIPRRVGGSNYFETNSLAPHPKINRLFRMRGITAKTLKSVHKNAMWLFEAVSEKNRKPMYETWLKSEDFALFNRVTDTYYRDEADAFFSAWKICKRNGYDYKKNLTEWIDTIHLLFKRKLDWRNPKNVCPADLHGLHNHLVELEQRDEERRQERLRRQRDEWNRQQAEIAMKDRKKTEKEYIKAHKKFFDLTIPTDHFTLVVLKSIDDFEQEGKQMHHCVFNGGYYRRNRSLILSARDDENKPVETIEVSLDTYKILQCYGPHDNFTPFHKEIYDAMMKNMWQVMDIDRGKVKTA